MAVEQISDDGVAPAIDFASHERQFRRFVHLTKWFAIHMFVALIAIYFLVVAGDTMTGALFLAVALAALGYGIVSTPQIARDVNAAVSHVKDPS